MCIIGARFVALFDAAVAAQGGSASTGETAGAVTDSSPFLISVVGDDETSEAAAAAADNTACESRGRSRSLVSWKEAGESLKYHNINQQSYNPKNHTGGSCNCCGMVQTSCRSRQSPRHGSLCEFAYEWMLSS